MLLAADRRAHNANRRYERHRGRKSRLVSLLESLYCRSVASGATAALVRGRIVRFDEVGRWQREPEIEQATLPTDMRACASWVRSQARPIGKAHARA